MASNSLSNGTQVSNGVGHVPPQKLWEHSNPESTPMYKFMQDLNKKYQLDLRGYDDLYKWSIDNIAKFWGEIWEETGVKASKPFVSVNTAIFFQYTCEFANDIYNRLLPRRHQCFPGRPGLAAPNSTLLKIFSIHRHPL
jgi:hypothetical protein